MRRGQIAQILKTSCTVLTMATFDEYSKTHAKRCPCIKYEYKLMRQDVQNVNE